MNKIDKSEVKQWLVQWVANETKQQPEQITTDEPFVNFGLGSRQAVTLTADLEDWLECELPPSLAWEYPTIDKLADYIATKE